MLGFDARGSQDPLLSDTHKRYRKPMHIRETTCGFFLAAFTFSRVHQFAQIDDAQTELRVFSAMLQ